MHRKPTCLDLFFLSAFAILITLQPYFLYGELNYFELGIYLPNISALLDGQVPYRDFFHLRGPLELYVPAFFMSLFGENAAVLATYFYIGTVSTLLIGIWIAKDIYRTRFVFYLMVPVFIGRTFPRAVFMNWGGMRYGLGLLAILLAIWFFKRKRFFWLVASGIVSGLALLTSVEIGVCAIVSILVVCSLVRQFNFNAHATRFRLMRHYIFGLAVVLLPYAGYLFVTQSMAAYLDMTYAVVTNMTKVFPDYLFEDHPKNFWEALRAMSPLNRHFDHLTPAYCYIFFMMYIRYKAKQRTLGGDCLVISMVAFYGLMMYITAFRKIGAAQFEMALQPEKIVLFFMLEEFYLWLQDKKYKIEILLQDQVLRVAGKVHQLRLLGIHFLILGFIMSSLGYAMMRYDHRFFSFQYVKYILLNKEVNALIPLAGEEVERMSLGRLKGIVVPSWQGREFKQLTEFFDKNTKPDERVFMFPELGFYSFIVDRPFVGRFPMSTFSWFNENHHKEYLASLVDSRPRFVIVPRVLPSYFETAHFQITGNKRKYDEVMRYVEQYYEVVVLTATLKILKLKTSN